MSGLYFDDIVAERHLPILQILMHVRIVFDRFQKVFETNIAHVWIQLCYTIQFFFHCKISFEIFQQNSSYFKSILLEVKT